jgi:hypothetical protein
MNGFNPASIQAALEADGGQEVTFSAAQTTNTQPTNNTQTDTEQCGDPDCPGHYLVEMGSMRVPKAAFSQLLQPLIEGLGEVSMLFAASDDGNPDPSRLAQLTPALIENVTEVIKFGREETLDDGILFLALVNILMTLVEAYGLDDAKAQRVIEEGKRLGRDGNFIKRKARKSLKDQLGKEF